MNKLRARLREPLPEHEMIRILKRNMRENLAPYLYSMQIYTVEQLRDNCKEVEKNFLVRDAPRMATQGRAMPPKRYINEVVLESSDTEEIVEEMKLKNSHTDQRTNTKEDRRNAVVCWNCQQVGHVFMDCPSMQRSLFCYKCGLTGVITPRCPKCQENRMRGAIPAGEPRLYQNPDKVV